MPNSTCSVTAATTDSSISGSRVGRPRPSESPTQMPGNPLASIRRAYSVIRLSNRSCGSTPGSGRIMALTLMAGPRSLETLSRITAPRNPPVFSSLRTEGRLQQIPLPVKPPRQSTQIYRRRSQNGGGNLAGKGPFVGQLTTARRINSLALLESCPETTRLGAASTPGNASAFPGMPTFHTARYCRLCGSDRPVWNATRLTSTSGSAVRPRSNSCVTSGHLVGVP